MTEALGEEAKALILAKVPLARLGQPAERGGSGQIFSGSGLLLYYRLYDSCEWRHVHFVIHSCICNWGSHDTSHFSY